MKPLGLILVCMLLMCGQCVAGDTLRGGLIGAAIGAIVGHNSSDINTEVAVPIFAAAGALLGSQFDSDWFSSSYYRSEYDDRWDNRGYRYSPYRYHQYPRDPYYRPRYHVHRKTYSHKRVAKVSRKKCEPVVVAPTNIHPGVEVTTITVPLANGTTIDFRILEANGRFIGPRGESYAEIPSGTTLAAKYVPENLRPRTKNQAPSGDDRS